MTIRKEIASLLMKGPVLKLHVQLIKLGYDIPEGELKKQYYGQGTRAALRDFQSAHGLPVTGTVDAATRNRIQQVLEEKGTGQDEPGTVPEQFAVHGQIFEPGGTPFANGLVQAFHKGFRSKDILLGKATTDEDGYYSIFYTVTALSGRKNANLFVQVHDSSGQVIASSEGEIVFNAPPDVERNLRIDPTKYRGASEYTRLLAKVAPLLGKESLASLDESEIVQLAGESGVVVKQLRMAVKAARLAAKIAIPVELIYGFFWQGLPANLPGLLTQAPQALRNTLQRSLVANIIPASMETEIEKSLEKMGSMTVQAPEGLLTTPAFLFKPGLLYRNVVDLDGLNDDENEFITGKLNEYLQNQILGMLGAPSEAMSRAVEYLVCRVDYRQFRDLSLASILVGRILMEVKKNSSLASEAVRLENHLDRISSVKVRDLLHLDAPINKNPILAGDIRVARVYAIADEMKLDMGSKRKLIEKGLDLSEINEGILETLVEDGILTSQQKPEFRTTIELCRLTGDNMRFVSSLRASGVRSLLGLTSWTSEDWQAKIKNGQIPLPPGETVETYARNIQHNIERTFPTQVMFNHLLAKDSIKRVECLDSLHDLLQDNDRLISARKPAFINWQNIGKTKRSQLQADLQDLTILSNNFSHLGVVELVNDKTISLDQKKSLVNSRVELIETFYKNNQELDLRGVNFFDRQDQVLNWKNISPDDQPLVRKQLMAYQRVLASTDTAEESQALLNSGYDSAMAVATQTEAEFMAGCGLDKGIARKIYERRNGDFTKVGQLHEAVRDSVQGQFKDLTVSNPDPNLVNDLREIDGFDDLFNSQNYCACDESKSILGPAAYFVDLMHFIEEFSGEFFKDAPDHPIRLKTRRGDLWTLKLTGENTHTLIPYLTIVNEVLENYLGTVISSEPDGDIYKSLSNDSKISFSIPFCLPLEELQLYLNHFGLNWYQIYRTLRGSKDSNIWRAKLALSWQEYWAISNADAIGVNGRFGFEETEGDLFVKFYVQDFLKFSGLTREQLDVLLNLTFNVDLKNITVGKELDEVSQTYSEILENVTKIRADFMHRFIRLWRKTSWTIPELDLVLSSISPNKNGQGTPDLNGPLLDSVAHWMDIQEKLNLNLEELCSLIYLMPESLFRRLFNVTKLFGVNDVNGSINFHHDSFMENPPNDKSVDPRTPILLGGLGITETELLLLFDLLKDELLKDETRFNKENGNFSLDLLRISMLYRHVRLVKALNLKIEDFVQVPRLPFKTEMSVIKSVEQIEDLISFVEWLRSSPFSISELRFILIGEESTSVKYKADIGTTVKLIQQVQDSAEPDKIAALKTQLVKLFNVTADHLGWLLLWVNTDINNNDIKNVLSIELPDDTSIKPDEIEPLIEPLIIFLKEAERALLVHSNLKFKIETIKYLTDTASSKGALALGIFDLRQLTIDNLKAFTCYQRLVAQNENGISFAQSILDDYCANKTLSAESIARLADLWKQDGTLIESLIRALIPPPNLSPIQVLMCLWECLDLCLALGINGFSLQLLVNDDGKQDEYEALCKARDIALGAFNSKYGDEHTRKEKLEPFLDRVNVRKRDVLCAYIIAKQWQLKFKDLQDIYAVFLLDIEMSGCFRISRLVAALSSLQLYVHRCLVNLEQSESEPFFKVTLTPDLAKEWEWRKNYRVWEANRKVFLYPENYLEPDLREDKTHIFKELEDELLQQKITKESAEAAYRKYVAQLMELAKLRIVGSYYDAQTKLYYFFGRTHTQPYQYYYRSFDYNGKIVWGNWIRMELAIEASEISALIHLGRLYIFWTEVQRREISSISTGNSTSGGYVFKVYTKYAFLDENNKWSATQKAYVGHISFAADSVIGIRVGETITDKNHDAVLDKFQQMVFRKPYPIRFKADNGIKMLLYYIWSQGKIPGYKYYWTESFDLHIMIDPESIEPTPRSIHLDPIDFLVPYDQFPVRRDIKLADDLSEVKLWLSGPNPLKCSFTIYGQYFEVPVNPNPDLNILATVHELSLATNTVIGFSGDLENQFENIAKSETYFFLQKEAELALDSGADTIAGYVQDGTNEFAKLKRYICHYPSHESAGAWGGYGSQLHVPSDVFPVRLSPVCMDKLSEILLTDGLESFLTLKTQCVQNEYGHTPDFNDSYGNYLEELFFHIPFLIASHLNADQKFEEAKWWYERIFNPTAIDAPEPPTDRVWRYHQFRNLSIEKMKDILDNDKAIDQYKKDPFDPHAIAALRLNAYQKTIVMKYIDNLIDWGDSLFAQDTIESINEATMIYVLAGDILGQRPVKLGPCETVEEERLTFENIGAWIDSDENSEFLITLENWAWSNGLRRETDYYFKKAFLSTGYRRLSKQALLSSSSTASPWYIPEYQVQGYEDAVAEVAVYEQGVELWEGTEEVVQSPAVDVIAQSLLAFCVPPNIDLLRYWDRVEDRLFKIRHCMNISGIRRVLALFQPPIDPMLLVRAKAAGLSLEKILEGETYLSPYRFSYLIEKAKSFAQTVQSFGSALLSALEKKDVEELTLLRSVHERHMLRMTKNVKKQQLQEAQHQHQATLENLTHVQNRIDYYQGLLDEGLTGWEITQQVSKHQGTLTKHDETKHRLAASSAFLIPQIGSFFSLNFGGREIGQSLNSIADMTNILSALAEATSSSAGLEASFQRRKQEWQQQLLLSQQEFKQVDKQRLATEVRQLIAEKDLELHETSMEQADEVYDFYKTKFTSLGLYDYLATNLTRLHCTAYLIAYEMALIAQSAYQFERDDLTLFITSDNWQYDRAGLLAGERLILQLEQMEKAYLEDNVRDFEINQSFSMALIIPSSLIDLREKGSCTFTIPEIAFNLFYPGQYKRLIKSVRLTIPCVTGPYTNISATLSLSESKVRNVPQLDSEQTYYLQSLSNYQGQKSIATSSAQNDGGVFELNFRDERYLPFEGAGAISTWDLKLPDKLRSFDYDTISDVMVHISYTAKYDERFRGDVERGIRDALKSYAEDSERGLFRLLSLKHEFPNVFHKLLTSSDTMKTTEFTLTPKHFPYFLENAEFSLVDKVKVYLKPTGQEPVPTQALRLAIQLIDPDEVVKDEGSVENTGWNTFTEKLKEGCIALSGNPITKWKVIFEDSESSLNQESIEDILILLHYVATFKFKPPD